MDCPICLEPITDEGNGMYTISKCGHRFHADCIFNWIQEGEGCPLCRSNLNPNVNKISLLKRISKSKNTSNVLKKIINELETAKKNYKNTLKEVKEFKENNKETFKEFIKINKKLLKYRDHIENLEGELETFPIFHLSENSARVPI